MAETAKVTTLLDNDTKEPIAPRTDMSAVAGLTEALDEKQDKFTFDTTPSAGSGNPVTSGGIYTALQNWYDFVVDGAGPHNSVYRGVNLGTTVTEEQSAHIKDGTFKGLYIGDYWAIGGINYRIAAFDYYYRSGDVHDVPGSAPQNLQTHHAVIVPDTGVGAAQKMNDTDITDGGYYLSKMYTTYLETAKGIITAAFDDHLLTHRDYFTNAVAAGHPSGGLWVDSCIDLMNENMVYGTNVFLPRANGSAIYTQYTLGKGQLPLFTFRPDLISNRTAYWLRDVVAASYFASVSVTGTTLYTRASVALAVRPAFTIS